jgi:hypothetical protein
VKTKRAHLIHQDLHKKYSEVVRTGPNMIMIDNPKAIPIIYTTRPGFIKVCALLLSSRLLNLFAHKAWVQAPFYGTLQPYTRDAGTLVGVFNTQDEAVHMIKSPITPIFSVSSAVVFESHVDEVLQCLSKNLDKRFVKYRNIFDLVS